MEWDDNHTEDQQKTKLLTGIGCFFGIVILGIILVLAWIPAKSIFYLINPEQTQLKISHSPNKINEIEILRVDDFPDPTLRINYHDKSINKTNLPDNISVDWNNDYEANVILTNHGREPDIVKVEFR